MRWRGIAAVATALALGAAACGGPSPSEQNKQERKQEQKESGQSDVAKSGFEVVMAEDAKGPAEPVEGAQKGGTLTVLTEEQPETFDPTRCYYVDCGAVLRLVTRTPTQLQLGDDGKYYLKPDLLQDFGSHNEDYTEWTFKLKEGLKFENGEPVTAGDMAYSVKRAFATQELTGGPVYQQSYFLNGGKYRGPFQPKSEGGGPDYAGVSLPNGPDGLTFELRMAKPFPDLIYYFSFPIFTPIPKEKDDPTTYGNHPMATGPYKFEEYKQGQRLLLTRNEHWDPETDPIRHQYPDKIDFQLGQDPLKLQEQLIADNGPDQTAMTYDNLDSSLAPKVIGKEAESRLVQGPGTCQFFIYLDTRKIPFEVRKALTHAWNYDGEYKAAGHTPLDREKSTTIEPPVTPGYVDYDAWGTGAKGNGHPKKAKKILKEAGELGFEIRWVYDQGDPASEAASTVRTKALKAAGFEPVAQPKTGDAIRATLRDPKANINIRPLGWCLDWPSAATIYPAIFDGRLIELNPGSAPNKSFLDAEWVNKEIDRIGALPLGEQEAEWPKLGEQMMKKEIPVIPTGSGKSAFLHGSKVGGVISDPFNNGPDFTRLFVKQ